MPNIDAEPIGLDEAKAALSIAAGIDDHDEDIERMVIAVREEAERLCRIPIKAQTVTQYLDKWPGGSDLGWWDGVRTGSILVQQPDHIDLTPGPLRDVLTVKIYDEDDEATQVSGSVYSVDRIYNRLALRRDQTWPTVGTAGQSMRSVNAVEITMSMGFLDREAVPQDLKLRMKERLLQRWRTRGDPAADLSVSPEFYGSWVAVQVGRSNPTAYF